VLVDEHRVEVGNGMGAAVAPASWPSPTMPAISVIAAMKRPSASPAYSARAGSTIAAPPVM
jgi:hypothetical protein